MAAGGLAEDEQGQQGSAWWVGGAGATVWNCEQQVHMSHGPCRLAFPLLSRQLPREAVVLPILRLDFHHVCEEFTINT